MKHINIIANNIVYLCNYIVAELKKIDATSNIGEIVFNCISSYKNSIGLEKFYLCKPDKEWNISFCVGLCFWERPNVVKIKFKNKSNGDSLDFQANVENTLLFVDQPLLSYIEGIEYRGYYHNYLYIDQFTKRAPIRHKRLYFTDIAYKNIGNMIDISRDNFLDFYNKLAEAEKKNVKIINIDTDEFYTQNSCFDINGIILDRKIHAENTTCVLVPNCITHKKIDDWILNNDVIVVNNDEEIPSLNKCIWIKQILEFIESYYSYDYANPGYYNSIIDLIMDHKLSGGLVYDCLFDVTTEDILKKRGLLNKIKLIKHNYKFWHS